MEVDLNHWPICTREPEQVSIARTHPSRSMIVDSGKFLSLVARLLPLAILIIRPSFGQALPFPLDMPLPGVTSYDPKIPTPEEIIGHEIGTRHTVPYQVEAYFNAIAAVSDRVTLNIYAQSYEGRNLIHAIVTSPTNHARLEEIREANLRLADDSENVTDAEIENMPVVLYQGYSVHGNEASGTEAAILYLYHLAAARGPVVEDALDQIVVILDPMFNPDGRDRFTDWVNRNRGAVAVSDTQDREHNEAWPGGRTNHYWFDLNRDWMVGQHPESRGRLKTFHAWRPHVLTDHHEMGTGSTFFFQPGIPSRNNPNTPERTFELTDAIAQFHAEGLDRIGSQYYTRESFDDFFYGKGSAFPDINGSVGILFEQASSRALERDANDGVLHYAFTVRNQFAASLSTLAAGAALRTRLLTNQRDFYRESLVLADKHPIKAYVVSLDRGRTRAQKLAQLLQRHRVELYELSRDLSIDGRAYMAGEAYVIPLAQRQMRLIKSVMERTLTYQDSLFYDVSTWTLPLAHDVDYGEYRRNATNFKGDLLGDVKLDGGEIVGGRSSYAYLMPWNRYFAPRSLYRFLKAGVPVRVMMDRFSVVLNGNLTWFESGTIVIPLKGRDTPLKTYDAENVHELVEQAAENDHTLFYSVSSGLTPDGPDLGGSSTSSLTLPVIGLLTGRGISSGNAGELWHLLSERFRIPVSLLDVSRLSRNDLSKYNVIVHPGGSLDDPDSEALVKWTKDGGSLIAMSGAINWAQSNDLLEIESKSFDTDSLIQGLPYNQLDEARGAHRIGGSIFTLSIDTTHPVGFGINHSLPVFHIGSQFYEAPETPGQGLGLYSDQPLLSGYISDDKLEQLEGSAGAVAARAGKGRVIGFMDRLSFRAYWHGSQRLFLNAVFFSRAF
ncbi:MAG: peptidase M14 [Bacteroidetes bacterium]|nr:MAG: peptidase M14 [Bacteroidota bacterium]